jgi:group I intron endonuclease
MFKLYAEHPHGICCIYKITNIFSGHFYIGSAKCYRKRILDHYNKLKSNRHPNAFLQRSFNKWGNEGFVVEIVEPIDNKKDLILIEQKWLDKLFDNQNACYNLCPTAGSALGRRHNKATKDKIRKAHLGKELTEEHKRKIADVKREQKHLHFKKGKDNPMWGKKGKDHPMWGRKHGDDVKRKVSEANKGKSRNDLRKEIGQYDLDGNLIRAYASTLEAFDLTGIHGIRQCAKGHKRSAGGFMWSYGTKAKIRAYSKSTNKGMKHKKESKDKISASKSIPVYQLDLDGNIVKVYSSITIASIETGVTDTNISRCCKGKRKKAGGWGWRYSS